ncbi:MAG: extensin family protein [Deltaproteobacteria bacterium]|nr:extensin family protein [Deltaproteobacteria bacterium]
MKTRPAILLAALLVPALAIGSIKPVTMFEKIISVHGTYLESTEPMQCGTSPIGPEAAARITSWFERVAVWPNFRHMYPMGTWEIDAAACSVPRTPAQCLADLDAAGVPYEPVDHVKNLIAPVKITGPVGGVLLVASKDVIIECELASHLPAMAAVLKAREITQIGILSSHRPQAECSFHAMGLALDVNWMKATHWQRAMWLKSDFEKTPELLTCEAKHETGMSRTLVGAACDLWKKRVFNTVITPNYNEGHANHFHFDVRPGDNRFFVR